MKKLLLIGILAIAANSAFCQTKTQKTDTARNAPITSTTAFRVKYDDLFKRNTDGSFSPVYAVQINGEIMGSGVPFTVGTNFGGVNVGAYAGHDLMVDTVKRIYIIRNFVK